MSEITKPNNILKKQKRIEQIDYLLENMKEPMFIDLTKSNIELANTFGLENTIEFNPSAITYRILNKRVISRENEENIDIPNFVAFMASIQDYLPNELKVKGKNLWCPSNWKAENLEKTSDEMLERIDEGVLWFNIMRCKIEDKLAENLYICGHQKGQYLQILERRFRKAWSPRVEQTINADVKTDNEIKIVYEDD